MKRVSVLVIVIAIGVATTGAVGTTNVVDIDGDGVPATTEIASDTDPLASDSDGDGLDDGKERARGTDPTAADSDDDGLEDRIELQEFGTNPTSADTDGDELEDGEEVYEHETDPTDEDTDGDGLRDGEEIRIGSSPHDEDTDGDGLDDKVEEDRGIDPTDSDTDGDGLEDGKEVSRYDTDPTQQDTDNDRLNDSHEIERGTDPHNPDTDGDGLKDGQEARENRYSDADPLRMDIFVEVDEIRGNSLSESEAERVVEKFSEAPTTNPDGSSGINLHVEFSTTVDYGGSVNWTEYADIKDGHFDHENDSHHYLLVVDEIESANSIPEGKVVLGEASPGDIMVRDDRYADEGSTMMHELGHSLGLNSKDHDGIDSDKYSMAEYPSVMNYNSDLDYYGYSDGGSGENDHDDWGYIEDELYVP